MKNTYLLIRYGVLFWIGQSVAGLVGLLAQAGLGLHIPFLTFDERGPGAPSSAGLLGYVIALASGGLFVAALFQGYLTVKRLETIGENWRQSAQDLRRLSVLLVIATLAGFMGDSLIETIAVMRANGLPALSLVLDFRDLSTIVISLIIYLVSRALDIAQAEIEENRQFL